MGDRKAGGLWDRRGLPCHSFLPALLSCTHTTPRFSFWASAGTQPLPCPGAWADCSLPGQTDLSSPRSGQRLLARFLSPRPTQDSDLSPQDRQPALYPINLWLIFLSCVLPPAFSCIMCSWSQQDEWNRNFSYYLPLALEFFLK